MPEKIGIVADSTSDFPRNMAEELKITFAPIHVFVDEENFLDGVAISKKEVIDQLKRGSQVRTTPPTPHEYAEIFENLLKTHDRVISFHVSSHLSDCYKSARNALSLLFKDQEARVQIIDTGSVSSGQAQIVKKARELIDQGVKAADLPGVIDPFMRAGQLCFTVEDLKWLKRGGRIGTMAAFMGTLLNIKPVIGLVDSELKPVGRYRGKDQAITGMIRKAVEISYGLEGPYDLWVSHIDDPESAEFMRKSLCEQLEKPVEAIRMVEIGSTIAAHAGPGSCGWAIMPGSLSGKKA